MSENDIPTLDLPAALSQLGDDREIYEAVLESYVSDAPVQVNNVEAGLDKGDIELAARSAHSLKSSSRTIGGMRLGDLAEKIELRLRAGDTGSVQDLLKKLSGELVTLFDALRDKGLTVDTKG